MEINRSRAAFNLRNLYYSIQTRSENGEITFSTPKPIFEAPNLRLKDQGERAAPDAVNLY